MNLPVILLAFANEHQPGAAYLRNLPKELNQLKTALEKAEEAGLCEVEILTNATLEQLFNTFRKKAFRGRIAVFHYSGHADSFELLLEDETGQTASAKAAGLVPFLASQNGLELVFLNGCHSIGTSQQLLDQGVPVVIGTVKAVSDKTATDLSTYFYRSLAAGLSIGQSWDAALNQLQADKKEGTSFYEKEEALRGGLRIENGRFPWEMHVRPGSEKAKDWSLPFAANNPTFGLPPIPGNYPLPPTPYLFLTRYTKMDAAIFFGRGNYIRDLYRRLTNTSSSPVIMLYGQSGVGKSSLLGAGLMPRLEANYAVQYVRRDPSFGLSNGLMRALGVAVKKEVSPAVKEAERAKILKNIAQYETILPTLDGDAKRDAENTIDKYHTQLETLDKPDLPDLATAWQSLEKEKPLIVIIDQVEEVFSRPNAELTNELEEFCLLVKSIFDTPGKRPQGKLLLSYRKDYDSEILDALKNHRIERERVFLDKIKKDEILEIVNGLTSSQRLLDKYQLEVEEGLDVEIADDLVVDPDSPIAPVLQIILTKLWQQEEKKDRRRFTKENYRQLKNEGILLGDFFHQQMDALREWEQEIERNVESSGLGLDLLNSHTTPFGTARSNALIDLQDKYQHQNDILAELIVRFKDLYLLAGAGEGKVTLAHDTLAPIIQKEIRDSDRPGQRALRILENKVADYQRNTEEVFIEEDDLALVEMGAPGMRRWTVYEMELVEKSRKRRAELQAERRRNRLFKTVATAIVAVLAVVASWFWWQSEQRRKQVEIDLLYNQGLLETNQNPTTGIAKMREAFRKNTNAEKAAVMKGGIYDVFSKNLFNEIIHTEEKGQLVKAIFDGQGHSFATSLDIDYNLRYYKVGENPVTILSGAKHPLNELVFSKKHLVAAADDQTVYRWPLTGGQPATFGSHPGVGSDAIHMVALAVSADGQTICAAQEGIPAKVQCWEAATGSQKTVFTLDQEVSKAAFFPDGNLLIGLKNGGLRKYELTGNQLDSWQPRNAILTALAFSNNGKWLAVGYEDNIALLWQLTTNRLDSLRDHTGAINQIAFSNDNRFLLTSSDDRTAKVWTVADYRLRFTLKGHGASVVSAVFTENDKSILTASMDNTIRKWDFPYPFYSGILETQGNRLEGLSFTSDGKKAVAIDRTGQVFEWVYNGGLNFALDENYPLNGTAGLTCMALSPDGKMAIGKDSLVQLWALSQRSLIEQLTTDLPSVEALAFNADGSQLLAVGFDSSCLVLKSDYLEMLIEKTPMSELDKNSRGQFPAQLSLLDENGVLSQFDKNNRLLVRHGVDGECAVNAFSEEGFLSKKFYPLPGQQKDCNAPLIAIHPSGQLILTTDKNGRIFIWEIDQDRREVMGF